MTTETTPTTPNGDKITSTVILLPILKSLHAMGEGWHTPKDVLKGAMTILLGPTPDKAAVDFAMDHTGAAAFSLRQRRVMESQSTPRGWRITDLGVQAATEVIPMPKPPKGAPPVRVNAPRPKNADGSASAASEGGDEEDGAEASNATAEEVAVAPVIAAPAVPVVAPIPVPVSLPSLGSVIAVNTAPDLDATTEAVPEPAPEPVVTYPAEVLAEVSDPAVAATTPPMASVEAVEAVAAPEPDAAPEPVTIAPPSVNVEALAASLVANPPSRRTKTAALTVLPSNAPLWARDPYLRDLVAANLECFGSWSPADIVCGNCVLAGQCRNAQAATLSYLADQMIEAEASERAKRIHVGMAKAMGPEAGRTAAALKEGVEMVSPHDGVCARTGQNIAAGEKVVYIANVGTVKVSASAVAGK